MACPVRGSGQGAAGNFFGTVAMSSRRTHRSGLIRPSVGAGLSPAKKAPKLFALQLLMMRPAPLAHFRHSQVTSGVATQIQPRPVFTPVLAGRALSFGKAVRMDFGQSNGGQPRLPVICLLVAVLASAPLAARAQTQALPRSTVSPHAALPAAAVGFGGRRLSRFSQKTPQARTGSLRSAFSRADAGQRGQSR